MERDKGKNGRAILVEAHGKGKRSIPRSWRSSPPATRVRRPSSMSPGGCWRMSSTARWSCTASTAGSSRSWLPAITCAGSCRWCGRPWSRPARRRKQLAGVAFTAGPGLIGALLTGAALARSLAYAWGVPAVGVHHLEGHLLAPAAGAGAAALSAPGAARLRGTYPAHRGGRHRTVPRPGRYPGRRRGRSLRQDRQAPRTALPGRAGAGAPGAERHAGRLPISPADARSARSRVQFLRPEDGRAARDSRAGDDTAAAGGRRPWGRRGDRRHARRQGGAGARGHGAAIRSWSPAASARISSLRAALDRGGQPARWPSLLSAPRVLHRQRGDDRRGGPGAAQGRRARRPCDPIAARNGRSRRLPMVPLQHNNACGAVPNTHEHCDTIRRPYLPARPDGRVHHRLHRLGAARQANRGGRSRAARGLSAAPRSATMSATRWTTRKSPSACSRTSRRRSSSWSRPWHIAWPCCCSRSSRWSGCASRVNKPGAIRSSRDVGVVIERSRADLTAAAAGSRLIR